MSVSWQQHLSPELVLVDEGSADAARAALPDPDDTVDRILVESAGSAREVSAALQRLTELSEVTPPRRRHTYRLPKLVGALATWSFVAVLLADTKLYALLF